MTTATDLRSSYRAAFKLWAESCPTWYRRKLARKGVRPADAFRAILGNADGCDPALMVENAWYVARVFETTVERTAA